MRCRKEMLLTMIKICCVLEKKEKNKIKHMQMAFLYCVFFLRPVNFSFTSITVLFKIVNRIIIYFKIKILKHYIRGQAIALHQAQRSNDSSPRWFGPP